MRKTFKIGIIWTRSAIALALMYALFSFGAMAQNNPDKPLSENEVGILVSRLKARLKVTVEAASSRDEGETEEIFKLPDARRNLAGKTRAQVKENEL